MEKDWLKEIKGRVERATEASVSLQANLFVYFIFLAISKTKPDGLIALVVPFEWTTRPSAAGLRSLLTRRGWNIDIFMLGDEIFEGVLTTACIVVIDKSKTNGRWQFFDVDSKWVAKERKGPTGSGIPPLDYEKRGAIWAMRGLSPGTQKVFTLSEGQRVHSGLSREDVVPCVTSLRQAPADLGVLDARAFDRYYVSTGEKCWLIRSWEKPSHRLSAYLDNVPPALRATKTCSRRDVWYSFKRHPVPSILYAAGFVSFGPKAVINNVGATPVGSVQGIYADERVNTTALRNYIRKTDFERRIVAHAKTLKKIEVKQMNSVLNAYKKRKINK